MQATPGLDAGVHEVNDYQYYCANDKKLGGTCVSGERVARANAVCSYCTVSGFPVRHTVCLDVHYQPFPYSTID